jgi:hypothetical protein
VVLGRYKLSAAQNSLLTDAMRNKNLEKMVGYIIELVYTLDVSANNGLFFFENTDCTVNFHIN